MSLRFARFARFAALFGIAFSTAAASTASPPSTVSAGDVSAPNVITIAVGQSGLTFAPASVSAKVGDVLAFSFHPQNHSVALGTWDQGCVPAADGGFFSGFVPVNGDESDRTTFRVTINTTDPMVFYCTAGTHCQEGMFGVVNPGGSGNSNGTSSAGNKYTLAAYAALAKDASDSVSPPAVFGGILTLNGTAVNSTSNSTLCESGSKTTSAPAGSCNAPANGTNVTIPTIPNISSGSVAAEHCIWAVLAIAMGACLV